MNEQKYDLFLNYSRTDTEVVQLLASELTDAGVHVWFDQWELVPGQDWSHSLEQAIEQSKAIGICIGRRRSGRLDDQALTKMLSLRQDNSPHIIIPILLPEADTTNIPSTLAGKTFVDFRGGIKNRQAINEVASKIFGEEAFAQLAIELEKGDALKEAGDLQKACQHYEQALAIVLIAFG